MQTRTPVVVLAAILLLACGKEVGRVGFTAPGTESADVPLAAGEVSFWTDIDVEWQGDASLTYSIDLEQGGKSIGAASCNPLGNLPVKSTWVESNVGSQHSRRGSGKMSCSANVATAGSTTVKATLALTPAANSLKLTKADLVIKQ